MPIQDDQSVANDAVLYRVLIHDNWIKTEGAIRRPASWAFLDSNGETSYFEDCPGVLAELSRIYPGRPLARVPASTIRESGFVIQRRPDEGPPDFNADKNAHVVAGPAEEIGRKECERKARAIAKHPSVSIIEPAPPQPPGAAPLP